MNVIIPIGGHGRRFADEGYVYPKPLVRSLGKEVIFWNIENLCLSDEDVVYVVYRKEFERFNFEDLVRNRFNLVRFVFVPIESETRGASETLLYALQEMEDSRLSELTLVVDSDNFYDDDVVGISRRKGGNLIFYKEDTNPKPIYSYVELSEDGFVLDIQEKVKISDAACVGAYCFGSAAVLLEAIRQVIVGGHKQKNEFYVSSLYGYIISRGERVVGERISGFNCLGTPNQLSALSTNMSPLVSPMRFCFDLDNTLVTYPDVHGDYSTVRPIERTISFVRFLRGMGHTIIIYTARRMRTHGGNVGMVQADIARQTYDTLDTFGIPYDEVHFGKPYANFYIDDLALRPSEDLEKMTGFYNVHPETRKHNRIEVYDGYVCKYSDSLEGEAHFYSNIPEHVSHLFARPLAIGAGFIKIEKINGIPASFLNVNGTLSERTLLDVLSSLTSLHSIGGVETIDIYANYSRKLRSRISSYDFSGYPGFVELSEGILDSLDEYESSGRGVCGVVHGDPVLTNILIDTNDNVKMIDMRGSLGGVPTIYGDVFYDYAKVYQSLVGYDYILMGKSVDTRRVANIVSCFEKYIVSVYGEGRMSDIRMIAKSLLLSLIPLHDDVKCMEYYELIGDF